MFRLNSILMRLSLLLIFLYSLTFDGTVESGSPLKVIIEKEDARSKEKSDGFIKLSVSGGAAPYQILIVSVPDAHTKIFSQEAVCYADSLKAGKYLINIADYNHLNTYSDEITIE